MFRRSIAVITAVTFLMQSVPAFADSWGHRDHGGYYGGGYHGGYHHDIVVHRLPAGYISLVAGGLALLYCAGLFYRYTPAGYVIVQPPVGAVIPTLPPGYTVVYTNGVPYYNYGYTYYAPAPSGYAVVAAPPVVAPPAALPAAVPAAQPAPAVSPNNAAASPAPGEEEESDIFEIHIPNDNGSYTLVTLRKTEKGFLGPQGEFYADHPTVEQLKARYIKK